MNIYKATYKPFDNGTIDTQKTRTVGAKDFASACVLAATLHKDMELCGLKLIQRVSVWEDKS